MSKEKSAVLVPIPLLRDLLWSQALYLRGQLKCSRHDAPFWGPRLKPKIRDFRKLHKKIGPWALPALVPQDKHSYDCYPLALPDGSIERKKRT